MRKMIIGLLSMLATACLAIGLVGCEKAVGIKDIYLNDNKELIVELTDGTIKNLGVITENTPSNYSEDLAYTISEDGTYYSVSGIGICEDRDIVIPATYHGLPVKEIAENAFADQSFINSVTLPDSVTSIGDYAFIYCSALTSIIIPDGVMSIGGATFAWCEGLTSIVIPDSVTSIGEGAFYCCTSLTSITVNEGNEAYQSIDGNLYTKDSKMLIQYAIGKTATSFTIPDSVTSIGGAAFTFCSSLTRLVIPDSVTSIIVDAFSGCESLTNIMVDEDNKNYQSIDGNLYTKDSKMLIQYAIGKTATSFTIPDSVTSINMNAFAACTSLTSIKIPDSVTNIGGNAFSSCSSLTSVIIGDSVTSIGDYAFFYCNSLTSVVIPDSVTSIGEGTFSSCISLTSVVIPDGVTSIGDSAFEYCDSLTSITFKGTVAEWNAISKGSNWNYNIFATEVVCSDGTVLLLEWIENY